MAALIVGLAILAVMMTVAMPVWKQMAQREKEAELVFRGEAIAHSIGMFQRKFANAYPPSLDVLVEQKFLRKKYKDPITGEDFVPLTQATGQAGTPGATPGGRGAPPPTQPQLGAGRGPGLGTPGAAAGGIIGVTSKSTDTSIRLYKGRSHYNEWAFVYTPPASAGSGTPGAPGRGNNPGQRGNTPFPGTGPFPPGGPGGPGGPGRNPGGPGRNPGSPVAPGFPGNPGGSPFPFPAGRQGR
jgi:type II secretory pathway pseudopilin PulG